MMNYKNEYETHLEQGDKMVRGFNMAHEINKVDKTLFEVVSLHYLTELEKSKVFDLTDFAAGFIKACTKMSLEEGTLSKENAERLIDLVNQSNARLREDFKYVEEKELQISEKEELFDIDEEIEKYEINQKPLPDFKKEENVEPGINRSIEKPKKSRGNEL